jgi:hypothetical protein
VFSFLAAGLCVVQADQSGNLDFAAAPRVTQSVTVAKAAQVVTFVSAPPTSQIVGVTFTAAATVSPSGLSLVYTANGACSMQSATVVVLNSVGTCNVVASQAGNSNFLAASATQSFAVAKGTQTISFTSVSPVNPTAGTTFMPVAVAQPSGLTVVITVDPSSTTVCSIGAANLVSLATNGVCLLNADQAGNAAYVSAPTLQLEIGVGLAPQSIAVTSTAPVSATVFGAFYLAVATATSTLPVAVSVSASSFNICSASTGGVVSFVGSGTCVVNFDQAGNATYGGAAPVNQTFSVTGASQTVTFTSNPPPASVGGSPYTPSASSSVSGLIVLLTSTTTNVCTLSGTEVTYVAVGSCVLNAAQAGSSQYVAGSATQTIPVLQGDQAISFISAAPQGATVGGTSYVVSVVASSGLPVALSIDPASVLICSLSGSVVSFLTTGSCVVKANQVGNGNYNAAPTASQAFTVFSGSQTLSFTTTAPAALVGGATYFPTATSSVVSLTPYLNIDAGSASVCNINGGGIVSFIAAGACQINANQDGNADYLAAPQVVQIVTVNRGTQTVSFSSSVPVAAAVGGSYNALISSTSGLIPVITIDSSSIAVCSIFGNAVSFIGVGTCLLHLSQAGNLNFQAAPVVDQSFAISKGNQILSFLSQPPAGVVVGSSYTPIAVSSSGLSVTVFSSTTSICQISSGVVSFLFPGQCILTASQSGSTNYNAASNLNQPFGVGLASQTISFSSTAPSNAVVQGTPYTVSATSTSGLTVVFLIDPNAVAFCTISGSVVTFTGVGNCVVVARQSGSATFNAAADKTQTIAVGKGSQTITLSTNPVSPVVSIARFAYTATTAPGLLVTLSSTTVNVCTTTGLSVTFVGAGTCTVNADQGGNAQYNAAPTVVRSFTVARGPQVVSFTSTAPSNAQVSGNTYQAVATTNAAYALTVSLVANAVSNGICTVSAAGVVSFSGSGTCQLDASQAGDANYLPASISQSFSVSQGFQSVTFTSVAPTTATYGGTPYVASAIASPSGLTVALATSTSLVCVKSAVGDTVSFVGVGTCIVTGNQAGSNNYFAASQVLQSFNVGKANQAITISSPVPSGASVRGGTNTLVASSTSGLSDTYSSLTSSVCSVTGVTVAYVAAGTCTVAADQSGSSLYNPAPQVTQTFTVAKGAQAIVFQTPPPSNPVFGQTYSPTAVASPSNLQVAITSATPTTCTISAGGVVSFVLVGVCTLRANQAGTVDYLAASQVIQSFGIGLASQTISITTSKPPSAVVGGITYSPAATATVNPVAITVDVSSGAVCSISGGVVSHIGFGTCLLLFNQAGNTLYNAAPQVTQSYLVGKGTQFITFGTTAPASATVGGTPYTVTASSSVSSLNVVLTVSTPAVCGIAGHVVSFLTFGSCTVVANQAGNSNWLSATNSQAFAVAAGAQTITITSTAPGNARVSGSNYVVSGTASSGLTVTYTRAAGVTACTLVGTIVSFVDVGPCTINFDQAGSVNYVAAARVVQTFTVYKGVQTVAFTSSPPGGAVVAGATYTLGVGSATPSGLPVSFSVDPTAPSVCSLAGLVVSFIGAGTCRLNANQAGNLQYNSAPQVQQLFSVGKGTQTVGFTSTAPAAARVGGPTYAVTATSTSGLAVVFSTSSAVCSVNNAVVSFLSVGSCVILGTQSGDPNWNSATMSQTFNVAIGQQTLSFTSTIDPVVLVGTAYSPVSLSSAGYSVIITVAPSSSAVCSINGQGVVSNFGLGTCLLLANQPGDSFYAPATQVQQSYGVATVQYFSSLPQLYVCASPTECAGNVSGIFYDQFAIEANLTTTLSIEANLRALSNCSFADWLIQCNFDYVRRVLSLNALRVMNLDLVLQNASVYNQSCATFGCNAIIDVVFSTYLPFAQAAAILCTDPLCARYLRKDSSASAVSRGAPGAMDSEMQRFDQDVEKEATFDLFWRTDAYGNCTTSACKDALFPGINSTFAVLGYTQRAYALGFQIANTTGHMLFVSNVDTEFLACAPTTCNSTGFAGVLSRKRAYYAVMVLWNSRLTELNNNCSSTCNQTAMISARSTAQQSL